MDDRRGRRGLSGWLRRLADRIDGTRAAAGSGADEALGEDAAHDEGGSRAAQDAGTVPPPDPRRDRPDESERIAGKAALAGLLFGRR